MNMFKPSGAKNVKEYMAMLPEDRRTAIEQIQKLIGEVAPELKENYVYNMPGYGSFPYTDYKKREIEWPTIAIASQKNYMSIYVCAVVDGQYLAEKYNDELGNVKIGRSCIRFKKFEDLNLETIRKIIKEAAKNPGLVGAKAK